LVLHQLRMRSRDLLGLDVARYPESDPLYMLVRLLNSSAVTLVLDVGANEGGYGRSIRKLGFGGRIVSFEPTAAAFRRLRSAAAADARWEARALALGDHDGRAEINVAGNSAASSSLLPMLPRHRDAEPSSAYTHVEEVEIRRLDSLWGEVCQDCDRPFLKLDVQGAEGAALEGAGNVMDHLAGVQLEMNVVPLYDGQASFRELLDLLNARGFQLAGLIPGFTDRRTGQLLAADGVFLRADLLV
jgi:FkbM family methyltransferase